AGAAKSRRRPPAAGGGRRTLAEQAGRTRRPSPRRRTVERDAPCPAPPRARPSDAALPEKKKAAQCAAFFMAAFGQRSGPPRQRLLVARLGQQVLLAHLQRPDGQQRDRKSVV